MDESDHSPDYERVAAYLQEELDEELRVVAYFNPRTEVVVHMRDDLQEQYTTEEVREILNELLLETTDHHEFERLFESGLDATVRVFEDRVVTVIPLGVQEALVVSLERHDDYAYLDVLDECQRLLGE